MILTCPACDTKYVVKDSAIPPEGRKVRCASCKHSWHQDSEVAAPAEAEADDAAAPFVSFGGPPEPEPADIETPLSEPSATAVADQYVAEVPEPDAAEEGGSSPGDEYEPSGAEPAEDEPAEVVDAADHSAAAPVIDDERIVEADWTPVADPAATPVEEPQHLVPEAAAPAGEWNQPDDDVGYRYGQDEEAPRSRRWLWLLLFVALLAAAAAAFWLYAPAQWREKAGIAEAGETPLKLMITSNDRQELASGNELLAVSGRVINPTDREQDVPPIKAELRNKDTKKVVHSWTIAPPARVLAPRSSASFNSAEVDIPSGGDELVVTLGG